LPFTFGALKWQGKGVAQTIPDSIRVKKSVAELVGLNVRRQLPEIRLNTKRLF
jgi:hypothetical protein